MKPTTFSSNRGDLRLLLGALFVALMGFASCADQDNLIGPSGPAGKATVDSDAGESLIISWACDTAVDSVWTIFYGADYRFQIHGEDVLFSHYLTNNQRGEYWTSELPIAGRVRAVFRSGGGACGLYSDVLDDIEAVVRIYKGDVSLWYRGTADARYVLSVDDVQYPIAFVSADGSVRHRDFYALHSLSAPRPAGLVELRSATGLSAYYLPVNFNVDALDGQARLPADDRLYLVNPLCAGDACAEREVLVAPSTPVTEPSTGSTGPVTEDEEKEPGVIQALVDQIEEEEEEEETIVPCAVNSPAIGRLEIEEKTEFISPSESVSYWAIYITQEIQDADGVGPLSCNWYHLTSDGWESGFRWDSYITASVSFTDGCGNREEIWATGGSTQGSEERVECGK